MPVRPWHEVGLGSALWHPAHCIGRAALGASASDSKVRITEIGRAALRQGTFPVAAGRPWAVILCAAGVVCHPERHLLSPMPLAPSRAEKWGIESSAPASTWTTLDREPRRAIVDRTRSGGSGRCRTQRPDRPGTRRAPRHQREGSQPAGRAAIAACSLPLVEDAHGFVLGLDH